MKILCQIVSVEPLSLIVSLPNQLFGHIPITQISSEFTALLEKIEESVDEEGEESEDQDGTSKQQHKLPDLADIFMPGQYLRAVVTDVHAPGTTGDSGVGRPKDDSQRVSRRVELSVEPHKVNGGIAVKDLTPGFVSLAIRYMSVST
jgi:rRNA biogenesis protein RRP5